MSEEQEVAPPTDVLALVLHEHFWWFFQSAQKQVLSTLTAPGAIHTLLNAAFQPTGTGLGLGAVETEACAAVFADGPVKYVNSGHGAAAYLVTLGKGSDSHRLAFSACQVLLTPPLQDAMLSDDALLTELFRFLALPAPLPTARAGYFTNVVYQLLEADSARLAAWIARCKILPKLLSHVENDSIRRLLCHRIDELVPIGGQPAGDGGTYWLGLLGAAPMLPLMHTQGVDLASVLLEQLSNHSSSEELAAAAADACESWAATASKGPAAAEGVMHAGIAVELLRTFHSELGARALLGGLQDTERDVPSAAAHAVLPLLSVLVQVEDTVDGSTHSIRWSTTPLRTQLRSKLPLLASWLRPGACGEGPSWCSGAPRVGRLRHSVAALLAVLCAVAGGSLPSRGLQDATLDGAELVKSGALAAMVEALFAFPTASVLHSSLMRGLRATIRQRDATTEALFRDLERSEHAAGGDGSRSTKVSCGGGGLLSAMTRVYAARPNAQNRRPPPQYYGHLEQLMTLARECRSIVSECESWGALCAAESASLSLPLDAQLEAVEEPVLHGAGNGPAGVYKRYPRMQLQHDQLLADGRSSTEATKAVDLVIDASKMPAAGNNDTLSALGSSQLIDSPRIDEPNTGGRPGTPPREAARQQRNERRPDHETSEFGPSRHTRLLDLPLSPGVRGSGNDDDDDDDDNQWETSASKQLPLPPDKLTVADETVGLVEPRGLRESLTGGLMGVQPLQSTESKRSPALAPLTGGPAGSGGKSVGGIGVLPPLALPPIRSGGSAGSTMSMGSQALPPPRLTPAPLGSKQSVATGIKDHTVDKGEGVALAPAEISSADCATTARATTAAAPAVEAAAADSAAPPGSTADGVAGSSCGEESGQLDSSQPPKHEAQKQTRFCNVQ